MSNRRSALYYWIQAILLTAFAFYIVYLFLTDTISYYIAPRMEGYVRLSAIGMYAIAVFQIYRALQPSHHSCEACDCDHNHHPRTHFGKLIMYGIFVVPLLLGFLTPDVLLGSAYAAQKGMNYNGSIFLQSAANQTAKSADTSTLQDVSNAAPKAEQDAPKIDPIGDNNLDKTDDSANDIQDNPNVIEDDPAEQNTNLGSYEGITSENAAAPDSLEAMFPYEDYMKHYAQYAMELYQQDLIEVPVDSFIEALTTLDLYKEQLSGKTMRMSGFVYRADNMADTQFAVGRIAMSCCSADAMPYGVLADFEDASSYADNTWVEVTGTLDTTTFNSYELVHLKITSITKIDAPKSAYVYPNYEFGF